MPSKQPTEQQPWCALHEHKISELHHEVFGNGKIGLRQQITAVDNKVDIIKTKSETGVRVLKWAFGVFLTVSIPFLLLVLGWGWELINRLHNR